jgi:hypothetical protein
MNAAVYSDVSTGDYSYYLITPTSSAVGRFTLMPGADPQSFSMTGIQDELTNDGGVKENIAVTGRIATDPFGDQYLDLSIGGVSLGELVLSSFIGGKLMFVSETGSYGEAYVQKDGPFSNSTFAGDFGLQLFGRDTHAVGRLNMVPPTLTGVLDVSHNGLTSAATVDGTISFTSSDRANISLSTAPAGTLPFRAYVLSPKKLLLISLTAGEVTMGWAEKLE